MTILAVNTYAASVYANTGFTFFPIDKKKLLNGQNVYLELDKHLAANASVAVKNRLKAAVSTYVDVQNRPDQIPADCWNLMTLLNSFSRDNRVAIRNVYRHIPNAGVETDVQHVENIDGVTDAERKTYATYLTYLALFMFACQPEAVASESTFLGANTIAKGTALATEAARLLAGNGLTIDPVATGAADYRDLLRFVGRVFNGANLELNSANSFSLVRRL